MRWSRASRDCPENDRRDAYPTWKRITRLMEPGHYHGGRDFQGGFGASAIVKTFSLVRFMLSKWLDSLECRIGDIPIKSMRLPCLRAAAMIERR